MADDAMADDPPTYRVINLGFVNSDDEFLQVHGINSEGEVVGSANDLGFLAFVWLPFDNYGFTEGMHAVAGGNSRAYAISDQGHIAGSFNSVGNPQRQARVWVLNNDQITTHDFSFPQGSGIVNSEALGLNDGVSGNVRVVGTFRHDFPPDQGEGSICECGELDPPSGGVVEERFGFVAQFTGAGTIPANIELFGPDVCDGEDGPDFAAAIAHDISNPLVVSGGFGGARLTVGEATFCPDEIFQCADQCGIGGWWDIDAPLFFQLGGIAAPPGALGSTTNTLAVNDHGDAVGWSLPDDEINPPRKAAYWNIVDGTGPVQLPPLAENDPDDIFAYEAFDVANPINNELLVVGKDNDLNAIVWSRATPTDPWIATNLNTLISDACDWTLKEANAINDDGWIAGVGDTTGGSFKQAYMLVPRDGCYGDISNGECECPDGAVNVADLLELLSNWGTDGPGAGIAAPFDVIDVSDLLELLSQWGACANQPPPDPGTSLLSLEEELNNVGLTMDDWDEFEDVMMNGTQAEKDNYRCWMERYLSQCVHCKSCPDRDPFVN